MNDCSFFDGPAGRKLAYHQTKGTGLGIVFLGGFMSDMDGTKAIDLEARARAAGRPFLRFDYSGHGQNSGLLKTVRLAIGRQMLARSSKD